MMNKAGFIFDEIFFRGYRKTEVKRPVFIVGVPRSGTTFLHRLLSKDKDRFTYMKTWEIIYAPLIIQKKFFLVLGAVDRFFSCPLYNLNVLVEKRFFKKLNQMHRVELFSAEEDELLLIHSFSTIFLSFIFPFDEVKKPFAQFDKAFSTKEKKRIMRFYKRNLQRHLYVFGNKKQILSKNPAFIPKIQSINKTFPDVVIINTVRTPFEVLPSAISLLSFLERFSADIT